MLDKVLDVLQDDWDFNDDEIDAIEGAIIEVALDAMHDRAVAEELMKLASRSHG